MKTLIHDALGNIISQVKAMRFKQFISLLLVGILVLSSTACASRSVATEPSKSASRVTSSYQSSSPYDRDTGPKRELYRPTQKQQGGMNNYADDAKYDTSSAQADREQRVKQAKQNLQNRASNPQDVIDNLQQNNPLGEKARETAQSIKNAAQQTKDDLAEETQQGMRNLKTNAERAKQEIPRVVDEATQNAKNAVGLHEGATELEKNTQRAARGVSDEMSYRGAH